MRTQRTINFDFLLSFIPDEFIYSYIKESRLWGFLDFELREYPSAIIYLPRISPILFRCESISSRERFSQKTKSISTDNPGRLKKSKLIAGPPSRAKLFLNKLDSSKKRKTSRKRQTFSKVSRTTESSLLFAKEWSGSIQATLYLNNISIFRVLLQ